MLTLRKMLAMLLSLGAILWLSGCGPSPDSPYVENEQAEGLVVSDPCGSPITSVTVVWKPEPGRLVTAWVATALPGQAKSRVTLFSDNPGYAIEAQIRVMEPGQDYVVGVNGSATGTRIAVGRPASDGIAWDTEVFTKDGWKARDGAIRRGMGCG